MTLDIELATEDTSPRAEQAARVQLPILDLGRAACLRHGTGLTLDAMLGAFLQVAAECGVPAGKIQAVLRGAVDAVPGLCDGYTKTRAARTN